MPQRGTLKSLSSVALLAVSQLCDAVESRAAHGRVSRNGRPTMPPPCGAGIADTGRRNYTRRSSGGSRSSIARLACGCRASLASAED
jgi:hypothetical protein